MTIQNFWGCACTPSSYTADILVDYRFVFFHITEPNEDQGLTSSQEVRAQPIQCVAGEDVGLERKNSDQCQTVNSSLVNVDSHDQSQQATQGVQDLASK